jgi:hypothetical protein
VKLAHSTISLGRTRKVEGVDLSANANGYVTKLDVEELISQKILTRNIEYESNIIKDGILRFHGYHFDPTRKLELGSILRIRRELGGFGFGVV